MERGAIIDHFMSVFAWFISIMMQTEGKNTSVKLSFNSYLMVQDPTLQKLYNTVTKGIDYQFSYKDEGDDTIELNDQNDLQNQLMKCHSSPFKVTVKASKKKHSQSKNNSRSLDSSLVTVADTSRSTLNNVTSHELGNASRPSGQEIKQHKNKINEECKVKLRKLIEENLMKESLSVLVKKQTKKLVEKYKKNRTNKFKHQFLCAQCKDYIIGDLFQCGACKDYSLCEFCESTSNHTHPFLKIKNAEQYVDSLTYELKSTKVKGPSKKKESKPFMKKSEGKSLMNMMAQLDFQE